MLLAAVAGPVCAAPPFTPTSMPLFLVQSINPNVLVMLDTSQSMDATMAGKVISGSDPGTRGNVARSVLRDVLASNRYAFNWGLGSFDLRPSSDPLVTTYGSYLGNASTMVYTNVCNDIVDGVGVSDKTGMRAVVKNGVKTDEFGPLPCVPNPEPAVTGLNYITFSRSGDDPDINDVLYDVYSLPFIYGIGATGNNYYDRTQRVSSDPNAWARLDFKLSPEGAVSGRQETALGPPARSFDPTDSGWLPQASEFPRQLWLRRALGFTQPISGAGRIDERIVNSRTTTSAEATAESNHFAELNTLLAPEEMSTASTSRMLKNAAQRTPLAGSLQTGRSYFAGSYVRDGTAYASPITQSCQRNYVVLATDGNPTGRKDGSAYTLAEAVNTRDPATGTYTFGTAARDVFTEIDALRSTAFNGTAYDVRTYVVGLGDTVANPGSIAALNEMARRGGTGAAFLASSGNALRDSLQSIVARIGTGDSAGASAALSGPSYSAGSVLYQAKFNPAGWTGDLLALPVNADGRVGGTPLWQASSRLIQQDWSSGRSIVTFRPNGPTGTGIPFRWPANPSNATTSELTNAQIGLLNRNPTTGSPDGRGALRLAYLRGDTRHEARNGSTQATFRNRLQDPNGARVPNVLGDIVDSAPLHVGAPSAGYAAGMETASYPAFAATWAGRTPLVYVGANDGMLHAFDAATGIERFAYVPNLVFSSLSGLTAPSYQHKFTVNGSPGVGDVFYDGAWRTLLVSGLRYGGTGLFALDVTDPARLNEQNAASVVRWEYTDATMGYVYAKPLILKTNDGKWSVIVGNGVPSEQGGKSRLMILDARTGTLTLGIDTTVGNQAEPNGLSDAAAVDIDSNGTADIVYAGDVQGNLWKFDLRSRTPANWTIGISGTNRPLFSSGDRRPITGAPDVTRHPEGGFMVVFGTGRYLAQEDVSTTATQTIYGIWDRDDTEVTSVMLQPQAILPTTVTGPDGDTYRFSTHRVGPPADNPLAEDSVNSVTRSAFFSTRRGWFIDLPAPRERVVAGAAVRGGRAVFSSIIPSDDPCLPGGTGWVIEVDAVTGNRRATATFDTNNDRMTTSADFLRITPGATGTNNASGWRIDGIGSQVATLAFRGESGNFDQRFVQSSDATLKTKAAPGRAGDRQRVMWRAVD